MKPGSKINIHTEGSGSPASMYIVCVADLERANIRWSLYSTDTFTSLSHIAAWKETEIIKTTLLRQHISMCRQLIGLVRRLQSSHFSDNINGICEIASNCPTNILKYVLFQLLHQEVKLSSISTSQEAVYPKLSECPVKTLSELCVPTLLPPIPVAATVKSFILDISHENISHFCGVYSFRIQCAKASSVVSIRKTKTQRITGCQSCQQSKPECNSNKKLHSGPTKIKLDNANCKFKTRAEKVR